MFPLPVPPKPAPLCSIHVTRLHRSYGCLRLAAVSALLLASYTCRKVRLSFQRRLPDLPGYRVVSMCSSTRPKTPGWPLVLAYHAQGTIACWPINTIGLTHVGLIGAQRLHGQHHLLPLHLAASHAYASSTLLPRYLQGWIPGPWLAVTWIGFPPTRLRHLARPRLMGDPRSELKKQGIHGNIISPAIDS
jgi:hypothetical protein